MGWRRPWPGRGPFSHLPPWQRPGWLYGRGACWWMNRPLPMALSQEQASIPPYIQGFTKEQEITMLEQSVEALKMQLDANRKRLEELKKESK